MKSIEDMNGVERAAALLVAMGPSIAADILRHLDEDSIEKITVEIARIDRLSPEDREELIGEFLIDLRRAARGAQGGESKAKRILEDAFGNTKAQEILRKVKPIDVKEEFDRIREIEPDVLFSLIKDESPQTIAVTMSYLPAEKSAVILKSLSRERAKDVALSMAVKKSIPPDILARVAQTIHRRYEEFSRRQRGLSKAGGVNTLIDILGHMTGDEERKILHSLDISMPEISEQIRDAIFTFEQIVHLTNTEIRILIDELGDDMTLARALKGAGDDVRFKVLRNMSQNRATDIINDMNALGPMRLSEINENRDKIMAMARTLHENGVISFKKSGRDAMVE
ncbi:MAG: flagellar motor switch protein FliG [Spirochaetes bacterium]|nr:flagellar motor switch protein FliG [Spirochaetota bacterium]